MAAAAVDSFTRPTSSSSAQVDDVRAPPLSSANALARFEYESGKPYQDATRVLMVEWMDTAETQRPGQWHITWEGRHSVLPAADPTVDENDAPRKRNDTHRMFFLLPYYTPIPPTVTLEHIPSAPATSEPVQWQTNPLPAIFPPELGASAREAGKKGVLHTLWAKKRLSVLSHEIAKEYKDNFEGIGLEMAIQERDWIVQNFGVGTKSTSSSAQTEERRRPSELRIPIDNNPDLLQMPNSPQTPRSPGGGRLLEKMRGLKIGTASNDWGRNIGIDTPPQTGEQTWHNPLSPDSSDVASSGFEAIKGAPRPTTTAQPVPAPPQRMAAVAPPKEWRRQQEGISSLAGIAARNEGPQSIDLVSMGSAGAVQFTATKQPSASQTQQSDQDDEDDGGLFQLPISPRSPDMAKSPFSFAAEDVAKHDKQAV